MLKFFKNKPQQKSDLELVAAYQKEDDMEALGIVFERYIELVYGVCLKYFKNKEKAEDGVMGVFEDLTKKLKKHEIENFRGWLHVVTRNYCLMKLRKKEITVSYDPRIMHSDEVVHPTFAEETNGEEKALKTCIEKLPEKQKTCINWFYFENKSYKDIADITGEELGRVRSNIQNGRRNLKNCIEKQKKTMNME
jgi:RNA polymerase sigma-70 factor (ECF subfamily)